MRWLENLRWIGFLGLLLCGLVVSCEKGPKPKDSASKRRALRPTLSFYQIPECFLCQQLQESLDELERDHSQSLNFRSVDYHRDASQTAIERFKLGTHGIVITSAEGDELWSMQAHYQEPGALEAAIKNVVR